MTAMLTSEAEVAIDFSQASAVLDNVRAATSVGLDVVVGTTGWDAQLGEVTQVVMDSGRGLLHAPNFSVGMHVFTRLVERAASIADSLDAYDVHVTEAHHRHKADHPSGTARRLADLVVARIARKERWSSELGSGPIDPEVLHVAVTRSGEEPGTHSFVLDGPDDRIELTHRARDRATFARGALMAAGWIQGRSGVYTMDDMLADLAGAEEG